MKFSLELPGINVTLEFSTAERLKNKLIKIQQKNTQANEITKCYNAEKVFSRRFSTFYLDCMKNVCKV